MGIAVLIHQVKAFEQREWYAKQILENACNRVDTRYVKFPQIA
jgi:hypothetical protein